MLKLGKFLVQVILVEEDEEGNVIGERSSDSVPLYGYAALTEFASKIKDRIEEENTTPQEG